MIHAMRRFGLLVVTGSILASPPLHSEGEHHWSYSGDTGPAQWSALESDYSACGVGK
jgi:carbonic anhydrase